MRGIFSFLHFPKSKKGSAIIVPIATVCLTLVVSLLIFLLFKFDLGTVYYSQSPFLISNVSVSQRKYAEEYTSPIEVFSLPIRGPPEPLSITHPGIYKRCAKHQEITQLKLLLNTHTGEGEVQIGIKRKLCMDPHFLVRLSGEALIMANKKKQNFSEEKRVGEGYGSLLWEEGHEGSVLRYDFILPRYGDYFVDIQFVFCNMKPGDSIARKDECVIPPLCGSVNREFNFEWRKDLQKMQQQEAVNNNKVLPNAPEVSIGVSNEYGESNTPKYLKECISNSSKLMGKCPFWTRKADVFPARLLPTRFQVSSAKVGDEQLWYEWTSNKHFRDYHFGFEFPKISELLEGLSLKLAAIEGNENTKKMAKVCFAGDSIALYIAFPILQSILDVSVNATVSADKGLKAKLHWSYINQVWPQITSGRVLKIPSFMPSSAGMKRQYDASIPSTSYKSLFANCTHIFLSFGQWNAGFPNGYPDTPDVFGESVRKQVKEVKFNISPGASVFIINAFSNPISLNRGVCPPKDWRHQLLIDEYNEKLGQISQGENITYIDTRVITGVTYDEPPDTVHPGPELATLIAKYVLWRSLGNDGL